MTSVFIVTEARLYREVLSRFLGDVPGLEVAGTAASPRQAKDVLARVQPDVALVDTTLAPEPAVGLLTAVVPGLKVVALAIKEVPDQVLAWVEAGASGYVSSDMGLQDLVVAIQAAAAGELRCSAAVAGALLRRVQGLAAAVPRPVDEYGLTGRQHEVVELVSHGLSNKEIAKALNVSVPTVKNHIHNIFEKLQVHRRADALSRLGLRYGEPGPPPRSLS
jgi:two-component system nitrate/nitrite response regulator NarL